MKRMAAVVVGAFLTATIVAGCGGGSNDKSSNGTTTGNSNGSDAAYCASLRSAERKLKNVSMSNPANVRKVVDTIKSVASNAPSKISADWQLLVKLLNDPTSLAISGSKKLERAGTEIAKDAQTRCKVGGFNVGG